MSFYESFQVDVCYQVLRGDIPAKLAAMRLNKSYRQTLRIIEKVRAKGIVGIKHGNFGKVPANISKLELKQIILNLYKTEYFDFNMTHFLEQIKIDHGQTVPSETFRLWAHEVDHVKRKHRKRKKSHPLQNRMLRVGMMIQMDGSDHDWFGIGLKPVLIGCIDDATSECIYAEFFPAEDRISVMTVMLRIFEKFGVPELVYVDQAAAHGKTGILRKFSGWKDHITDLERTLYSFGCRMIFATSPQGKGRVERMWNTFQDRLIPEIRRQGIKRIPRANEYLWNHFIPNHNKRFGIIAANQTPAWKVLSFQKIQQLHSLFYLQEFRKILSGKMISLGGVKYIIEHKFELSLEGMQIEIRTYLDGQQKLFYADKEVFIVSEKIVFRRERFGLYTPRRN
ncbi:MAG: ISNCY family transposase [Bdellovibrio sp.]|nr:ISNCY family transposase [Bdellovibrio sp.]